VKLVKLVRILAPLARALEFCSIIARACDIMSLLSFTQHTVMAVFRAMLSSYDWNLSRKGIASVWFNMMDVVKAVAVLVSCASSSVEFSGTNLLLQKPKPETLGAMPAGELCSDLTRLGIGVEVEGGAGNWSSPCSGPWLFCFFELPAVCCKGVADAASHLQTWFSTSY
jgi:hypothetical protein